MASDVDRELNEYRATMESIENRTKLEVAGGGGGGGAAVGGDAAMADATKAIAATINQLPELQEKKRLIDTHMNIATELLAHIRSRAVDSYYAVGGPAPHTLLRSQCSPC